MESYQFEIAPQAPFDFYSTVYSHGWVDLAPTSWNPESLSVSRIEQLDQGEVVRLEIFGNSNYLDPRIIVKVHQARPFVKGDIEELQSKVAWMLRLDEDLDEFHNLCRSKGGRWTALAQGRGRLLRSPNLFEDIVKTICTTNIQWGGTKRMVANLAAAYGAPMPGEPDQRAFPAPEAILEDNFATFASRVRLGYRAAYIYELAERMVSEPGVFDARQTASLHPDNLRKLLLGIKGVGEYAAATLLMLLGQYGELAVDTEFREFMSRRYFPSGYPGDEQAKAVYAEWGRWKYLAYWFDNYSEV